ncbi:uncharacterized protein [Venturia canescens]|nr:uncharacterized protein LOC122410198 isoform X2 [Venturia canescens]XP_043274237.1 uncharacterized protein LOC122410198 isoform X2 [Venturia canescens]
MFDEGDFEVVDECTGEEDPSPSPMDAENSTKSGAASEATEVVECTEPPKQTTEPAQNPVNPPKRPVDDSPDFTEDVEMDGPQPTKGDSNDGDTLVLDASEILCCDTKDGDGKSDALTSVEDSKETDSVVESVPPEPAWYEEKLNAKMDIVKERLSKLARVLELSYPAYKPWLEHNKSSVCHFDPPRRCPLNKPHTNRWKFICSRKTVQESTNKEEDSAEGTVNKKLETVWRLGPTDGSGLNTDNASQYPPFVMRVVKVFEEFIQNIERSLHEEAMAAKESSTEVKSPEEEEEEEEKSTPDVIPLETPSKDESNPMVEGVNVEDDVTEIPTHPESGFTGDRNHNWLWLLVRSNSKDELMVFATGKKISAATMQKLKQTFETGPGKDCNVKSLYCKSIDPKSGNTGTSNITFLAGTEALDETVGGVKIQLAPKTNFWCNASGVEQLGAAVGDMLSPLQKTTVIEVGCGLGLIGLMVASKCKKVLGLDAPSEVEEAEMTSELNKVQNASFVMGQTSELITKVTTLLKNTKASAIVNGNTKLGRDIEMMTALRKIPSLRRIVMITTLTKQSVRAMLELTRPVDGDLGNPFMPLRAILVDTLPTGPHFEVVIRMERLNLENMNEPWFWDHVKFRAGLSPNELPRKNPPRVNKGNAGATVQGKKGGVKASPGQVNATNAARRSNNRANRRNKMRKQRAAAWTQMVPGTVTGVVRNPVATPGKPATSNLVKNPMAGKANGGRLRGKNGAADKANGTNAQQTKPVGATTSSEKPVKDSPLSPDPSNPVKVAKSTKVPNTSTLKKNPLAKGQPMRQRLSGAQKRKRHWATIEAQKQGGGTAGNQGPSEKRMRGSDNRGDLRGRLSGPRVMQQAQNQRQHLKMNQQRMTGQNPMAEVDAAKQLQNMLNMVLDQTNKLRNQIPRSVWHRIAPPDNSYQSSGHQNIPDNQGNPIFRDRFVQNMGPQDIVITTPNSEFGGNPPPVALFNRGALDRSKIMPAGMNPQEVRGFQDSLRGIAESMQGGRNYRKNQGNDWNPTNQVEKTREPMGNKNSSLMPLMESIARPPSPKRSLLSPSRAISPARRYAPPLYTQHEKRQASPPPRHQASPPRRELTPPQRKNPYSDIFHRRPVQNRPQSSENSRRGTSPVRRDYPSGNRGLSPPKRFSDDWDMNRGDNMNQGNWNQRQQGQMQPQRSLESSVPDRRWSSDKTENSQNWNSSSLNDRFRQTANKRSDGREGMWMSGGGDVWNSKQTSGKSGNERQWQGGNNGQGPSGDQWNGPRGNDNSYGQSNNRNDNWRNSGKGDKQWMDLPDDAKDPWGDDPMTGKSRWQSDEPSNSNWGRNDKMEQNWSNKSNDNWQNKGSSLSNSMPKPLWSSFSNQNSNDQQRWMPQNEPKNSIPPNNWQGNNFGSNNWRPQNYSGFSQQQRNNSYGSSNYKDGR